MAKSNVTSIKTAVILAGGFGTRFSEETDSKPKPMIEIGGIPILWHLIQYFRSFGVRRIVVCCGYMGEYIKRYLSSSSYGADITIRLPSGDVELMGDHFVGEGELEILAVDTGLRTMTGGRLRRIKDLVGEEPFFMTYGDGVSDVDLSALEEEFLRTKPFAMVTAVVPPARFGAIQVDFNEHQSTTSCGVIQFAEKPLDTTARINGGFFVLTQHVFSYLHADQDVFEQEPLRKMAKDRKLRAYMHDGFWQSMDTRRDHQLLQKIWDSGVVPWVRDKV